MLTIHKASAGSGKTFTLAYEYIKMLLAYKGEDGKYLLNSNAKDAHRNILAVTFTIKATGEMKRRIIKELAALSADDNSHSAYLDKLTNELNATAVQIQLAAKSALQALLNDFSNFNVSTIDSFFQNILRTFAREAEVQSNYDIELQDKYAIKVGVSDLLSSLSDKGRDQRQLLGWLKSYMCNQIDNESSWNVFAEKSFSKGNSLHGLAENLSNENVKEWREELEEYLEDKNRIIKFQQTLRKSIKDNEDSIYEAAKDFERYLENNLGFSLDYLNSRGGLLGFCKILENGGGVKLPAGFTEAAENPQTWFLKAKVKGYDCADDYICNLIDLILNATKINKTYKLIGDNLFELGLLGDISRYVFKFRTDNNLILLSDTNELLKRIINDDDTPFIYERIGVRLKHFLIDEFQDTSRVQWHNFKPLLTESLSSQNDNLIIGDVKQSIYRFRNADPNLLQSQIYKDLSAYKYSDSSSMNTNWRSASNIIEFNNNLFELLAKELHCTEVYANIRQEVAPKNIDNKGYVKVNFVAEVDNVSWGDSVLNELPDCINAMLARGLKQRDIAILVSQNAEGVKVVERIFKFNKEHPDANIKVISDESLLLKNSPSVRLIIGILKHINGNSGDSKDIISTILKEYEYNIASGSMASDALKAGIESAKTKDDNIGGEFDDLYGSSLISITEYIINNYINVKARAMENAYIQAFQDTIIDFSARNTPTVHHFMKWWEGNQDRITVNSPATTDAINIMTIHKSKGLEFAAVIVPFCDWDLDSGRGVIWQKVKLFNDIQQDIIPPIVPIKYSKDLANTAYYKEYEQIHYENVVDTLNKTYVAFTRAGQELHIYTPNKAKSGSISQLLATKLTMPSYELGSIEGVKYLSNQECESEILKEYPVNTNLPKLRFKLPSALVVDTPRDRGILLHKIFSLIEYADGVSNLMKQCESNGLIKSENIHELEGFINSAVTQSELTNSWFSHDKRVLMERSILKRSQIKRPDRIVIDADNNVTIIDYKFGEKHSKRYEKQIAEYAAILREAGFTNVKGYLWYPTSRDIITID